MTKRFLHISMLLVALMLLVLPAANAVPTLTLISGLTNVTVVDGGVGDSNPLPGVVTYLGPVGLNWTLNVTSGVTKPDQGSATNPLMDLSSQNGSKGAGSITIIWSDNNFGPLAGGASFKADIGGTAQNTAQFTTYYDATNAIPAATLMTTQNFGSGAFSGTAFGAPVPGVFPFSLTEQVIITHSGKGLSSFDASLSSTVPEPSALLLLGSGLSALGIWRLRKKA